MFFNKKSLPAKSILTLFSTIMALQTFSSNADTIAITHATVYTATDQGVLTDATVIVENGKIIEVYEQTTDKNSNADKVIDAKGRILTPGFIGTLNQLGLVEVNAVSKSRDAKEKKADITFDASLAFNPKSTVIPFSRKGGITRDLVVPLGGDSLFKGFAFVVNLSGDFDSVLANNSAVVVGLGSKSKGSRAYELQSLANKLEDVTEKVEKAKKKKNGKDDEKDALKRDEKIVKMVLNGEKPLLAYADRATDMLELITLKKRYNLKLIIAGAADATLISEQLASNNIVVIIDAMSNLPGSFDSLHSSLSNAATLTAAGVNVILSAKDAHNLYQLRFRAGNAVANGMSKHDALLSITANVADAFSFNAGRVAKGYDADLVLWSADPFEISSKIEHLWIEGKEQSTTSRQDALRDRYTTQSQLPRAYTK